ncbi:aspartic proteinase CDR1-like [Aristolochia californica]|uniref:aspartic proteinase CDR1-like n=1 Tax=Aristolochia californica TaxID=171875 RepID=UPI0035D91F45
MVPKPILHLYKPYIVVVPLSVRHQFSLLSAIGLEFFESHSHVMAVRLLLSLALAVFFFAACGVEAGTVGFSVELVRRDSPRSPFYNPLESSSARIARAVKRSKDRVDYFLRRSAKSSLSDQSPQAAESSVLPNGGDYLMTLALGTPPVKILAIADTGSDLIWTQCKPCENCYKQDDPLFDPESSSSYRNVSCQSAPCQGLRSSCSSGSCQYQYSYGDQSYTIGTLATETFTFDSTSGSKVKFPKSVFGCGHENQGTFTSRGAGLVGLGGGSLSLIRRLGSSIDGKFSYCLVPLTDDSASSVLSFGRDAIVSGQGAVSTPLVKADPDTFYYLSLEKITVGKKVIEFPNPEGNIIIDSGTTLTYLISSVFDELTSAVSSVIDLTPVKDPQQLFQLCYRAKADAKLPYLNFGFSGANLRLAPLNTFIEVEEGIICLAVLPSDGLMIFGNVAQQNYKVGYDLAEGTVSFASKDCAASSGRY